MKIGILTYHNTRNCGALLQAYALQKPYLIWDLIMILLIIGALK